MRCLKRYVAHEVYRDLNPIKEALDKQYELYVSVSEPPVCFKISRSVSVVDR